MKLSIQDANLRALAGGVQKLDSNDTRFLGVGAAVRTDSHCRFPSLLLCRSWHGLLHGVWYMSVTFMSITTVSKMIPSQKAARSLLLKKLKYNFRSNFRFTIIFS